MNIQIFGSSKSFDSKKAERYFKERRIKYQYIDMRSYEISPGELKSVKNSVGLEELINTGDEDYALIKYLAGDEAKLQALYERQYLLNLPIVRNGKSATVGYKPEIWAEWK